MVQPAWYCKVQSTGGARLAKQSEESRKDWAISCRDWLISGSGFAANPGAPPSTTRALHRPAKSGYA